MTFQRFFDAYLQKNRIDHTKGFIPWGVIMSTFESYIRKHWPRERDENIRKHVSWALKYTKIRNKIPASILDKHEHRLHDDLETLGGGAGRSSNSAQQPQVQSLHTDFSLKFGAGNARLGIEAVGDFKKRGYAASDGPPASPEPKHLKMKVRLILAHAHGKLMFHAARLSWSLSEQCGFYRSPRDGDWSTVSRRAGTRE